jgi:putative phage-type endonuclease
VTAVLIPTASEAEWLEARRRGVTASEIAVIMGLSPYGSAFALYHQKRGELPDQGDDLSMAIGRHFEDFVADQFAERHDGFFVEGDGRALYAHPGRPWQMATPDRLLFEEECNCGCSDGALCVCEDRVIAVLECKTDGGFDGWGDDGTDEIPVHYRCQLLWQMDVLGVITGFVACLFMNRRQLRVYELTMDDNAQADLALMETEARRFLQRIDRGDPPDVDWRPATRDALSHLHPELEDRDVTIGRQLAISYRAACRRYKEAEQRKDEMANRLLDAIGGGKRAIEACTGLPVAGRQVYDQKRVSSALVRERHPAVAAECTATSTVRKLVPARAPKEPK